jgi:pSer/pThr/pTyr-binding forkhead associated (FHA) protein
MLEGLPGFLGRLGLVLGALALSATALVSLYRQAMAVQNVVHIFNRVLRNLADLPARLDQGMRDRMRRLFFRPRGAVLPAEVRKELERVMLARENTFEEDPGAKIVPNEYVVELHDGIYQRHYQPEEKEIVEGWQRWLVELLDTTNNRYGDRRYRFWGPVQVTLQAAGDLHPDQVRVQGRINAGTGPYVPPPRARAAAPAPRAPQAQAAPDDQAPPAQTAAVTALLPASAAGCLELLPAGPQWRLRRGTTVLGRSESADVYLDMPHVQEKRLISGHHATIRCSDGRCRLFDGSPGGQRSVNGTYVNGRRVPPEGHELLDGDVIVLAAVDPDNPRPDLPGVVGLIFHAGCP